VQYQEPVELAYKGTEYCCNHIILYVGGLVPEEVADQCESQYETNAVEPESIVLQRVVGEVGKGNDSSSLALV
jgi:hypothetical protein